MSNRAIVHLIPTLGKGGIEVMVVNFLLSGSQHKDYSVVTLFDIDRYVNGFLVSPVFDISKRRLNWNLLKKIRNAERIILSTYWSSLIANLLFIRFEKRILFVHRSSWSSLIDRLRLVDIFFAGAIIADSEAANVFVKSYGRTAVVIAPFFFPEQVHRKALNWNFISTNRFHPGKNTEKAIFLFERISLGVKGKFYLYGADSVEKLKVKRHASSLISYKDLVFRQEFDAPDLDKIMFDMNFFILLSDSEGFSISTAEAMSRGVVPIVHLVGGLKDYCVNGINCLAPNSLTDVDLESLANRIVQLTNAEYERLSENAKNTFKDYKAFIESFNTFLNEI